MRGALKRVVIASLAVAFNILPACTTPPLPGSAELEEISIRTLQAEVVGSLPSGSRSPGDGVVKGHRLDRYFVDGDWVEVLWVEPPDGAEPGADPRLTLNPVVFQYGGLDGWGWDHFDARAEVWGIEAPQPEPPLPQPDSPPEAQDEEETAIDPEGISA